MKLSTQTFRMKSVYSRSIQSFSNVSFNISPSEKQTTTFKDKSMHCYRTLFPWENFEEFCKYVVSCVEYNKDGLLVLNKPYGIKIHGHDKPGARPATNNKFLKSTVPVCDYTIEDSLPVLKEHFNLPSLSIVKSAEKYSTGVVLLSYSDRITRKIQKSFNIAKLHKKPHLIHWAVTLGYPVVPYRKERVGIKFIEIEKDGMKQPVIQTEFSKRDCKLKKVHPVQVESRLISKNEELSTSLIEIATSSVKWHFVRVYASSRMSPILGDILYGSRMQKFLGIPIKVSLTKSSESGFEHLPPKMSDTLVIPRGTIGYLMIPTMIHLRSILLPDFYQKGQDYTVTVSLPRHFDWTINRLNLLF